MNMRKNIFQLVADLDGDRTIKVTLTACNEMHAITRSNIAVQFALQAERPVYMFQLPTWSVGKRVESNGDIDPIVQIITQDEKIIPGMEMPDEEI